jgi:hypothetical protein
MEAKKIKILEQMRLYLYLGNNAVYTTLNVEYS